jgi:hypothetical protein
VDQVAVVLVLQHQLEQVATEQLTQAVALVDQLKQLLQAVRELSLFVI